MLETQAVEGGEVSRRLGAMKAKQWLKRLGLSVPLLLIPAYIIGFVGTLEMPGSPTRDRRGWVGRPPRSPDAVLTDAGKDWVDEGDAPGGYTFYYTQCKAWLFVKSDA